jgi:hypothetical protein
LIVSVACGAVLVTGGVATADLAKTRVTIEGPQGDFRGEIFSAAKNKCLGNRTVKVFKQLGADQAPSTDTRIGSDVSERNGDHGEWSVGNTGFKKGKFYARATRTSNCKAGSSPTIKL